MIFKASLDKLTLSLTIGITILFLVIGVGSIYLEQDEKSDVPIYVAAFFWPTEIVQVAMCACV